MDNRRYNFLIREVKEIYKASNRDMIKIVDNNGNYIIAFHCSSKFTKYQRELNDNYCIDRLRIWIINKNSPTLKIFNLNEDIIKLDCEVL
jgi:hypothetical protein